MKTCLGLMMAATLACGAFGAQKNGAIWYATNGHVINAHGSGMLTHGGRYYLYGEHKVYGTAGNRAHVGVHVYSSSDLNAWTDEGVALSVSGIPAAAWIRTTASVPSGPGATSRTTFSRPSTAVTSRCSTTGLRAIRSIRATPGCRSHSATAS